MEKQTRHSGKYWKRIAIVVAIAALLAVAMLFDNRPTRSALYKTTNLTTASNTTTHAHNTQQTGQLLATSSSSTSSTSRKKGIQICGIGVVDIDPDDDTAINHYLETLVKSDWERWKLSLINHDSVEFRTLGFFLQLIDARKSDDHDAAATALDSLIELAANTNNAITYGIAYRTCNESSKLSGTNHCDELSAQRWAEIDPGNAASWLLLANEAQKKNDATSFANALDKASKASFYDSYSYALVGVAQDSFPQNLTPVEKSIISAELFGVLAAWSEPAYHIATQTCSADAVKIDARRQQCNALAELLVDHSTGLLDMAVGKRIGAHTGWPPQRVAEVTQEMQALMAAIQLATRNNSSNAVNGSYVQPADCTSIQRINDYVEKMAQLGEIGAANFYLEHSGRTTEEMAHQYLDAQSRRDK